MSSQHALTTARVRAIFAEEIAAAGGTVSDTFDDGSRLFVRSVLSRYADVVPGDRLQSGVALRAAQSQVWVHPYVFRQVCRNGAIVAHAVQTRHVEDTDMPGPEAADAVREAIRACCEPEAFTTAVAQTRSAREREADMALTVLPFISRLPAGVRDTVIRQILDQFSREPDRSAFGLMNAVTAVARDTRDPDLRWRLEELGGAVAAGRVPTPKPDHSAAVACAAG